MKPRPWLVGGAVAAAVIGFGPVSALATPGSVTCTGVLTGALPNVVVPENATCVLDSAVVDGNVDAHAGSVLQVVDSFVDGNVRSVDGVRAALLGPDTSTVVTGNVEIVNASGGGSIGTYVCGTDIGGNLSITQSSSVAFGGRPGTGAACRAIGGGNTVGGNARVDGTHGPFFRVADNTIGGNLIIVDTVVTSTQRVLDNDVSRKLNCSGNTDLLVSGNTAARSTGQCALS